MTVKNRILLAAIVCLSGTGQPAHAQEWTRFRGPNGSGISHATTVPVKWTDADYNWRIKLPGIGHGSPVLWGNRLFVNAESDQGQMRIVLCIDSRSGKRIWARSFPSSSHRKHRRNSFASCTPAVDRRHVYVAWATPKKLTLAALNHNGELAWASDLGRFRGGHGFAASPIVFEELVVLANDQDGPSSLIAVNRNTGKVHWNVPRKSKRTTYSTPCVYRPNGRPAELIFTNWQHGITAIDPKTGSTNWEISVFDTTRKERAIGSPVVAGDLVIGTCGFVTAQKHVVAVRPGSSGKPDDVDEVYRIERAVPHVPTAIVYQKRLYLWSDKGIVTCCDQNTGKAIWQQRVGGNFFGSPVCVNSRLFAVDDSGVVVVLAAADTFQQLGRNPLGDRSHCTPAIANGTMFLRTFSQLVSIGGPQ